MSSCTYIASNTPLPEVKNPHCKSMSVNEALSMGMIVPDFLLNSDSNRDAPGVILWLDTETKLDTELGALVDGDFDDDLAILILDGDTDDIYTEKKYKAYMEWTCTKGRSQKVIEYIREQLTYTDEIEIWNIWKGSESRPQIDKRLISIEAFTSDDLVCFENSDVFSQPSTQYCLVITKESI
ncbi:hypothetical protein [Lacrimispora algidixylanolytica]|uniref:Uncharacterized protein n=1 Tax=Lacrimispora algidixylanolytica TaxID=94868 RepID=A0A419T380_9FIRM|nr:hypothetical protein [Lacrimispora algidixylanolytica]RKD31886.1 hypothetical protein BET01_19135 [Lacrimispora algidixylanolytica]